MTEDIKRKFARINDDGRVLEIIEEQEKIEDEWHPDFLAMCVDVTDHQTQPEVGWQRKGNGQFAPYQEPEPPPEIKARAALAAGIKVNGETTFHVSGPTWQAMRDEAQYIATFGEFSTGADKLSWSTKDGPDVEFGSTDDFMKMTKALGRHVAKWQRFGSGQDKNEPEKEISLD